MMKLPVTRRELRHFGLRVRRDWRRLAALPAYAVASVALVAQILPEGTPNGWQATAFFLGYMAAFCGGLVLVCKPRTKAR